MKKEIPKRLAPTYEVSRELFLRSGNQCAFPGCDERIMDKNGTFVGQVCHIEAALPNGERFNKNQTNEDRRSFDNLMLMCYKHHRVTNDTDEYTVKKLKKMKKDHEKKFSDAASRIQESISDLTASNVATYTTNCSKVNTALDWGLSKKELSELSAALNEYIDLLKELPLSTRSFFKILIQRADKDSSNPCVYMHEVKKVTALSYDEIREHHELLHRKGFVTAMDEDDSGHVVCTFKNLKKEWEFWEVLPVVCEKYDFTLDDLLIELNFELLD